jgi:hypothetical protein
MVIGDSNTVERLRNSQINLDAVRHDYYAGSPKRIVNQVRFDTVSSHTLFNVLQRGSEHLFMCPMFYDDNLSTNQ